MIVIEPNFLEFLGINIFRKEETRSLFKIFGYLRLALSSQMAMCQKADTGGKGHRREPGFTIPLFGEWATP